MTDEYQEPDKRKLLQRGDRVMFRDPVIGHPVTVNELHAFQLGLVGLLLGTLYASSLEAPVGVLVLLLVGYSIFGKPAFRSLSHDDPEYKTIGMKTIKHEPWWFLTPLIITFYIGTTAITPPL